MAYFVVSDIHGHLNELNNVLKAWNPDTQQLIILGDMVDRGPSTSGVLERCRYLQRQYGAWIVYGNHEDIMLDMLRADERTLFTSMQMWLGNGGLYVLDEYYKGAPDPNSITVEDLIRFQKDMRNYLGDYVPFMDKAATYIETPGYIFVHAGVNLSLPDWRHTSKSDACWMRKPFDHPENKTGKIIVFGHTPVRSFWKRDKKHSWDPYHFADNKIGIDGGVCFNGQLNGCILHEGEKRGQLDLVVAEP